MKSSYLLYGIIIKPGQFLHGFHDNLAKIPNSKRYNNKYKKENNYGYPFITYQFRLICKFYHHKYRTNSITEKDKLNTCKIKWLKCFCFTYSPMGIWWTWNSHVHLCGDIIHIIHAYFWNSFEIKGVSAAFIRWPKLKFAKLCEFWFSMFFNFPVKFVFQLFRFERHGWVLLTHKVRLAYKIIRLVS